MNLNELKNKYIDIIGISKNDACYIRSQLELDNYINDEGSNVYAIINCKRMPTMDTLFSLACGMRVPGLKLITLK